MVEGQCWHIVERKPLGAGSIIATLHILQAHQSIVGNGNHTLTWVAVGSREGVELLDKGRLKASLLLKLTPRRR